MLQVLRLLEHRAQLACYRALGLAARALSVLAVEQPPRVALDMWPFAWAMASLLRAARRRSLPALPVKHPARGVL